NNPTTRMSTPASRIQSGMEYQTRPSGRPDANDSSATAAVRHERMALARLANGLSWRRGDAVTSVPCREPARSAQVTSVTDVGAYEGSWRRGLREALAIIESIGRSGWERPRSPRS